MAVEVTLLELIGQGRLALDMRLHHKGRIADRNVVATVVAGGLRVKTRTFATPSAAAKAVTGGEVDGWAFWRLPDGRRLDALRPGERRLD
jgi:hypothetical protein